MIELKIKLPDHFLDEEVRCGYLVSRKMKEVWAVELDLLAEFQRVCEKYSIRYFASGGLCLERFVIRDLFHGMMILT